MTPYRTSDIQKAVAEFYRIPLTALIGPSRLRDFSHPRFIAYHLARKMTDQSLAQIGRAFGGRDHTTILSGLRRVQSDDFLPCRQDIETIETMVEHHAAHAPRWVLGAPFVSRRKPIVPRYVRRHSQ